MEEMREIVEKVLKVLVYAKPYIVGGTILAQSVKSSWQEAKKLYEKLKSWLIATKNYDILGKLEGFLEQPAELQEELKRELLKLLKEDKAFAKELQQLLEVEALQEIIAKRVSLSEFIQEQTEALGKQSMNVEDAWGSKFKQTMGPKAEDE